MLNELGLLIVQTNQTSSPSEGAVLKCSELKYITQSECAFCLHYSSVVFRLVFIVYKA